MELAIHRNSSHRCPGSMIKAAVRLRKQSLRGLPRMLTLKQLRTRTRKLKKLLLHPRLMAQNQPRL